MTEYSWTSVLARQTFFEKELAKTIRISSSLIGSWPRSTEPVGPDWFWLFFGGAKVKIELT